ncbi:MAG: VCBS repeat-containing protein, partial [Planctomycetia bacterium]|nr:VCBS repeat-containing protein [Planctomycetia bacterium]
MRFSWLQSLISGRPSRAAIRRRNARFNNIQAECLETRQVLTMLAPTSVAATAAADVEIRDFNGDGVNDIASLNASIGVVSVMLGNGDGSFQAGVNSAAGGTGTKMAASDFNHDGKLDLVTVEGYQIDLLKGNGDGSFQAPISYYASAYPNDIDVGDVNNDGLDDVFTASFSYGGTTQLFVNDGLGGFLPSHNLAIGPTGMEIEGADVNGDGNLDLVQSSGSGWYAVLVGHGDGTFVSAATTVLAPSQDLKVDDFNGDGMADMVVTNGVTVSVYAGSATAAFQSPTNYPMPGATRLELGDINGDGHLDVVGNNSMVMLGRGNGGFYAPTAYGTAPGTTIGLGDINGDGSLDAVSGTALGLNATINGNNDIQLLAGATQISVSATGAAQAGVPFAVTVTALDVDGNVVTGFQGTVGIMGAAGTMPVSYTFSASDNGVHTIADAAKLFALGSGTYSVTSPFLPDASGTVDVAAGPAAKFTVAANQITAVAGTSTSVTVSAFDAYGNAAASYLGTVHFTSSDIQAGLPSDYAFTADDAGSHTFAVALAKVGFQQVSAIDSVSATVKGSSGWVTVTPAAAATLTVTAPTGYVGSVNAVYVHALDAYGNMATGYNGVVHLTSSDAGTTVSNDAALFNGSGTLTFTPTVMGPQTLTANDVVDGSVAGSGTANVTPGWGARFVATALPSTMAAGQTQYTTLTVYDAFDNVSTVYTGWVLVSGSDSRSASMVYFTAADAGVKTIPVTLYTAGVQSVTISDYYHAGVTFTQTGITVTAGAVRSISATPLQGTTAGTTQSVTVTGHDIYGNVATGYTGTVTFASTDTLATLPTDYTFTEADAGSHTFAVTFKQSGTQDITIADNTTTIVTVQYYQTALSTMTYSQIHIPISPDVLSTFAIKGASSSNTTAGSTINLIVTPSDVYGNTIDNYTGTVRISTTDVQAILPSSYTFNYADAGTHTFAVTLKTAGSQSITFTDSANSAITGGLSGLTAVTVKAAAASKFSIVTPTSVNAGNAQSVAVAVTDAYGNAITSYTGTVKVTSSDAQAILPANYTFTNKDSGAHTFSVTLKTVGNQSITLTDTTNAAITATQSGIAVNQVIAQVASFTVSGFAATTAGTAKSFTVTAKDASGSVISGYTGTINFSSSDVKAGLPASYTFTAADAGSHTFSATLKTAGAQSITVKDAAIGTAIGTQSGISVTAGVATQFVLSAPSTAAASSSVNVKLTVYDAYGNIATGYTGKVTLTSTDSKGGSPSYSFSSRDAGVHVFSYKFGTVGSQTLT